MNIIRLYKLHNIFDNVLTEKEINDLVSIFNYVKYTKENEKLIDFIYNNFLNLEKITLTLYPNNIFYFKNDKLILDHELDSNWIVLNLESEFYKNFGNINNYKYLKIFERLIKNNYNIKNKHLTFISNNYINYIENIYLQQKYEHNKII